jgi:hypothetical protein
MAPTALPPAKTVSFPVQQGGWRIIAGSSAVAYFHQSDALQAQVFQDNLLLLVLFSHSFFTSLFHHKRLRRRKK